VRAILMYHSIDDSGSPISVGAGTFERHVDWLARERDARRLSVVPLADVAHPAAGDEADDVVAITFDDAFTSFATEAWPRLRDRGLPATVFVVSDHVGGDNRWGGRTDAGIPVLPLLGWEDLARLGEEGAELGGHSRTHPNLASLDRGRVEAEVAGCREAIERETGRRPVSFAYPFGRHGGQRGDVAREVAAAWFEQSVTTELAAVPSVPDRHLLPRLDAFYYRAPGRLEAFGRLSFRLHLVFRARARGLREAVRPHGGV
jgi:peptidoglycan/xylan/chitin deacetylase (PgdA/CDA1 family)